MCCVCSTVALIFGGSLVVYRDVENIENVTKEDILEFYATHFRPGSATRTTFSIHLIAQTSAEDIAAKITPEQQNEKLVEKVASLLAKLGIQGEAEDMEKLSGELKKVDITSGDLPTILSAIGTVLDAGGLPKDTVKQVLSQMEIALPPLLPAVGIKVAAPPAEETPATTTAAATDGATNGVPKSKLVKIENAKAFKASLPLGLPQRPVKDLSEFEELEPKL